MFINKIKYYLSICFCVVALIGCSNSINNNQQKNLNTFPYQIHMLNKDEGFAYGRDSRDNSKIILLTTRNGGESWNNITPKDDFNYYDQQYGESSIESRVAFLDIDQLWIVKSEGDKKTVYSTVDSGKTWRIGDSVLSNGYIIGLTFVSPSKGWMTIEIKQGLGYSIIEIFSTNDSGITWTLTSSVEQGTIPFDGEKTYPTFVNSLDGFMGVGSNKPILYRTINGGKSWSIMEIPLGIVNIENFRFLSDPPIFFNDKEGIFKLSYNNVTMNIEETKFFITEDGGKSWIPLKSNINQ